MVGGGSSSIGFGGVRQDRVEVAVRDRRLTVGDVQFEAGIHGAT